MWMQNVWAVARATPAYLGAEDQPVNECPQDTMIVDRFVHMFKAYFGERFTIFSSGEGGGWASLVALRTGVNAIVTESNKYSYFYLTQRLLLECGSLILSEENKNFFLAESAFVLVKSIEGKCG